jgi:hypothetical protein
MFNLKESALPDTACRTRIDRLGTSADRARHTNSVLASSKSIASRSAKSEKRMM